MNYAWVDPVIMSLISADKDGLVVVCASEESAKISLDKIYERMGMRGIVAKHIGHRHYFTRKDKSVCFVEVNDIKTLEKKLKEEINLLIFNGVENA